MINVTDSDTPAFHDLLSIVVNLVPDLPKPSEIFAEISDTDRTLWLEGWCDGCIARKGFPHKGKGMHQEKLDHIREVTPSFLQERAEEKGMKVKWYGFLPLDNKEYLYGVSWGIFVKE